MKTYKLHLIRHGLTQGNLDGLYVGGGTDMPLCEEGKRELRTLAACGGYPPVGLVFTSPMRRALQSAEILYPHVAERRVLEDLRENRFGVFEGRSLAELAQDEAYAKWLDPASGFVPEGGESGAAFATRCARALMDMMTHLATNGIAEAACVAHGGVIMSMLSQKGLPSAPPRAWRVANGHGYTVQASAAMLMRDALVEVAAPLPLPT